MIYPLEFSDLKRDDGHPFGIDATGATFWFDLPDDQAPTRHFCVGFRDCRNISFKDATIDRATRRHVEGRITPLDFANNRIELQLSPGITLPATFNDKLEQRVIPVKAAGTFCAPLYALQAGGVHLEYKQISPATAQGRCWVTMDGIRVYAAKAWGAEYGGEGAHVYGQLPRLLGPHRKPDGRSPDVQEQPTIASNKRPARPSS